MEYRPNEITYYKLAEWEKKRVVERVKNMLEVDERVKLAYVFGSFTRRDSIRDIDLAVYAAPPLPFNELLNMNARMELELNMPIDMVQLQDLGPAFRLRILRHSLPILIKDKQLYHSLVALTFSELLNINACLREASKPGSS